MVLFVCFLCGRLFFFLGELTTWIPRKNVVHFVAQCVLSKRHMVQHHAIVVINTDSMDLAFSMWNFPNTTVFFLLTPLSTLAHICRPFILDSLLFSMWRLFICVLHTSFYDHPFLHTMGCLPGMQVKCQYSEGYTEKPAMKN